MLFQLRVNAKNKSEEIYEKEINHRRSFVTTACNNRINKLKQINPYADQSIVKKDSKI